MAHLQALVAAQTDGAGAASEGAPSVADDLASLDDFAVDDDQWSKVVGPSKRKALLRRERDVLAGRIRTSLGK
eukprot:4551019-Pyramimonas_sp.AAC.1